MVHISTVLKTVMDFLKQEHGDVVIINHNAVDKVIAATTIKPVSGEVYGKEALTFLKD